MDALPRPSDLQDHLAKQLLHPRLVGDVHAVVQGMVAVEGPLQDLVAASYLDLEPARTDASPCELNVPVTALSVPGVHKCPPMVRALPIPWDAREAPLWPEGATPPSHEGESDTSTGGPPSVRSRRPPKES